MSTRNICAWHKWIFCFYRYILFGAFFLFMDLKKLCAFIPNYNKTVLCFFVVPLLSFLCLSFCEGQGLGLYTSRVPLFHCSHLIILDRFLYSCILPLWYEFLVLIWWEILRSPIIVAAWQQVERKKQVCDQHLPQITFNFCIGELFSSSKSSLLVSKYLKRIVVIWSSL